VSHVVFPPVLIHLLKSHVTFSPVLARIIKSHLTFLLAPSTLQKFAGLAKAQHSDTCVEKGNVPAGGRTILDFLGGRGGGVLGSGGGRIALIADEAHRSHGAGTSIAINQVSV